MSDLINEDLVLLDVAAPDKSAVTRLLAERLAAAGRVTDLDGFLADVQAREAQMATGLPGGIGIPHARSKHVTVPTLGFARVPAGVDFGAEDGPATLVFLIAAPDGGGEEHMKILASLARKLIHQSFRDSLLQAPDAAAVVEIVRQAVSA
ncbi:fructose-specific phosphotransferase system IIA component [Kineosporia succinea]|uniref:Fructose-specific phosphotransferase system IIA component n=1 Tax=Kineosporia succinea TaxID=84632 RepID=A0ABT9PFE7_9ACTN|nr:fructose PTS transporter subunit IIA [Kineosporia succinea]MDP9831211.1 fructose-specific phosphotransferase system IIA component [Kineosporia succinea]